MTADAVSLQSCPTLCDPIDGSPPGSPVPGILQARTLEWVAISLSSNVTGVLVRTGRCGHRHRWRDSPAQMLGEDGRPQARERGGGQVLPSQLSAGANSVDTTDSRAPEPGENKLLLLTIQSVGLGQSSPSKRIHPPALAPSPANELLLPLAKEEECIQQPAALQGTVRHQGTHHKGEGDQASVCWFVFS